MGKRCGGGVVALKALRCKLNTRGQHQLIAGEAPTIFKHEGAVFRLHGADPSADEGWGRGLGKCVVAYFEGPKVRWLQERRIAEGGRSSSAPGKPPPLP